MSVISRMGNRTEPGGGCESDIKVFTSIRSLLSHGPAARSGIPLAASIFAKRTNGLVSTSRGKLAFDAGTAPLG